MGKIEVNIEPFKAPWINGVCVNQGCCVRYWDEHEGTSSQVLVKAFIQVANRKILVFLYPHGQSRAG